MSDERRAAGRACAKTRGTAASRPRFVHSPRYSVHIGDHVFPTAKFALAAKVALSQGLARESDFVEPALPPREDLLLAHAADWVDRAMSGKLGLRESAILELPWSKDLAEAHALAVAGTILACRQALATGLGLHVGGGAHHAFPDHGEGFCAFNDIACGILAMRREARISRAAVVDLDVHQGNGTNAVFARDKRVMTFSMHQADLYPFPNWTPGTVDIPVEAGTGDAPYLETLERRLGPALDAHRPELVVYQAGADGYEGDLLGGLKLTRPGLRRRDELVFSWARNRGIPMAVTLGGGYAPLLGDTVSIHVATLEAAVRILWR